MRNWKIMGSSVYLWVGCYFYRPCKNWSSILIRIVMKRHIFLFLTLCFLYSCKKDNGNSSNTTGVKLIGTWKLIDVYNSPGAGGSFVPVNSEKKITFHSNGTISSNGTLCDNSINTDSATTGIYSDSSFTTSACSQFIGYNFPFEQNDNILIIHYPCFEPCQSKYEKE